MSRRIETVIAAAIVAATAMLGVPRPTYADTNSTPIAIPLLGTQGAAGPYPSTIAVTARGGANHTAAVRLVLHSVTHPCIEDLAVLLVHGAEKFLVLSNAGGCPSS